MTPYHIVRCGHPLCEQSQRTTGVAPGAVSDCRLSDEPALLATATAGRVRASSRLCICADMRRLCDCRSLRRRLSNSHPRLPTAPTMGPSRPYHGLHTQRSIARARAIATVVTTTVVRVTVVMAMRCDAGGGDGSRRRRCCVWRLPVSHPPSGVLAYSLGPAQLYVSGPYHW